MNQDKFHTLDLERAIHGRLTINPIAIWVTHKLRLNDFHATSHEVHAKWETPIHLNPGMTQSLPISSHAVWFQWLK